jgi:DNA-binding NarL/FixJ family response regulator
LWRDAVARVLETVGVETRAKLSTLAAAPSSLARFCPDLVIAETAPDDDIEPGRAWVRYVADEFPETKVVVLSHCHDEMHIAETLARGATAYVVKSTAVEDLAATVRQIFDRSVYLRPLPAARVVTPPALTHVLTPRELDILRLAAEGYGNARIARILWVTEQTVKFHLSNVYRKINVTNRTEASHWAQLHGLLDGTTAERRDQVA